MAFNEVLYKEIMEELDISKEIITDVAGAFRWDLEQGLKKSEYSSLPMLPSFIGLPDGNEKENIWLWILGAPMCGLQ